MTTRREIVKAGAGLAAIIAARRAPAALIRSMLAARNGLVVSGGAEPPTPGPAYWGLCFTAEDPGVVINMTKSGSLPAVTLETSPDGVTWTPFDADNGTTPVTLSNVGDQVFFRAGASGNNALSANSSAFRKFTIINGKAAASGSIMSLLDRANANNTTISSDAAFCCLFIDCTNLTAAPDMTAEVLSSNCYYRTFQNCSGLSSIPLMSAKSFGNLSCFQMFGYCTGLTSAKVTMQTITTGAISGFFSGCSNLSDIEVAFSSFANGQTRWVRGVAASGTFRCPTALGTDATIQRGQSYCPAGWTVINTD